MSKAQLLAYAAPTALTLLGCLLAVVTRIRLDRRAARLKKQAQESFIDVQVDRGLLNRVEQPGLGRSTDYITVRVRSSDLMHAIAQAAKTTTA